MMSSRVASERYVRCQYKNAIQYLAENHTDNNRCYKIQKQNQTLLKAVSVQLSVIGLDYFFVLKPLSDILGKFNEH